MNNSFSLWEWEDIIASVLQESILGPTITITTIINYNNNYKKKYIYIYTYMNDIFFFVDTAFLGNCAGRHYSLFNKNNSKSN